VRAGAQRDELLIDNWSPVLLKMELDRYLWPDDAPHVGLRQVCTNLATYVYLPRLRNRDVFLQMVKAGAASIDFFGYAVAVEGDRYQRLSFGRMPPTIYNDERSVLVQPEAARQANEQTAIQASGVTDGEDAGTGTTTVGTSKGGSHIVNDGKGAFVTGGTALGPTQFYGSVALDSLRLSADASKVATEVLQHLAALLGAEVTATLEIRASVPGGVPVNVVRTVTGNAKTLGFNTAKFEE
jgi:hypothetical protein